MLVISIEPPPQPFFGQPKNFYYLVLLLCEKSDNNHKCTGVAPTLLSQCISWSHWVSKWSTMCKQEQCVWWLWLYKDFLRNKCGVNTTTTTLERSHTFLSPLGVLYSCATCSHWTGKKGAKKCRTRPPQRLLFALKTIQAWVRSHHWGLFVLPDLLFLFCVSRCCSWNWV